MYIEPYALYGVIVLIAWLVYLVVFYVSSLNNANKNVDHMTEVLGRVIEQRDEAECALAYLTKERDRWIRIVKDWVWGAAPSPGFKDDNYNAHTDIPHRYR